MKKIFNFESFYWDHHHLAYYISEPVTSRAGLLIVDVYAKGLADARTILKELERYSILAIERNGLCSTHFRIVY